MKADEMYDRSLAAQSGQPPNQGLPLRLWNALAVGGFIGRAPGEEPQLKIKQLREAILNGKIWRVRNVGETYVRLLCKWLEENAQPSNKDEKV